MHICFVMDAYGIKIGTYVRQDLVGYECPLVGNKGWSFRLH